MNTKAKTIISAVGVIIVGLGLFTCYNNTSSEAKAGAREAAVIQEKIDAVAFRRKVETMDANCKFEVKTIQDKQLQMLERIRAEEKKFEELNFDDVILTTGPDGKAVWDTVANVWQRKDAELQIERNRINAMNTDVSNIIKNYKSKLNKMIAELTPEQRNNPDINTVVLNREYYFVIN